MNEQDSTTTTDDGLIVNTETGEIVGVAEPEARPSDGTMSDSLVEWVLQKILTYDSRAAAAEATLDRAGATREAMIDAAMNLLREDAEFVRNEAVIANAKSMREEAEKKAEFFRARYSDDLGRYAAANLGTSKTRTLKTTFGAISLRTVPAKLTVSDEASFIEWASRECPEAVKRTPLISKVGAAFKDAMLANPEAAQKVGLAIEPESTTVTIKTGVAA